MSTVAAATAPIATSNRLIKSPDAWYSNITLLYVLRVVQFMSVAAILGMLAYVKHAIDIKQTSVEFGLAASAISLFYLLVIVMVRVPANVNAVIVIAFEVAMASMWLSSFIVLCVANGTTNCKYLYRSVTSIYIFRYYDWRSPCRVGQASIGMAGFAFVLFACSSVVCGLNVVSPISAAFGSTSENATAQLVRGCNLAISNRPGTQTVTTAGVTVTAAATTTTTTTTTTTPVTATPAAAYNRQIRIPNAWHSNTSLLYVLRVVQFMPAIAALGMLAYVAHDKGYSYDEASIHFGLAASAISLLYLLAIVMVRVPASINAVAVLVFEVAMSTIWLAALITLAVSTGRENCKNAYYISDRQDFYWNYDWRVNCKAGQASAGMAGFAFVLFACSSVLCELNVISPIRAVFGSTLEGTDATAQLVRGCNLSLIHI